MPGEQHKLSVDERMGGYIRKRNKILKISNDGEHFQRKMVEK